MPETSDEELSLQERLRPHLPKFIAALAAASAGLGTYALLRKQRLSSDPALAEIQRASKGLFTRTAPGREKDTNALVRAANKYLFAGGGRVAYEDDLIEKARLLGKMPKLEGAVLHDGPQFATGDVDVPGPLLERLAKIFKQGDKGVEAKIFQKYAPGSVPETVGMSSLRRSIFGDSLANYDKQLRERFPQGFILKTTMGAGTKGRLPTSAKSLADHLASGGPEADVVRELLRKPSNVIAQEKLPIQQGNILDKLWGALRGTPSTREMRVHVFNGAVAPDMTLPRFSPFAAISPSAQHREAENFVKDVLQKLPQDMQKGTYAFDVAPVAHGGFKIIESNPGYLSGFLSPGHNPNVGAQLHRTFTGRTSPAYSALAGALAATGAGLVGHEIAEEHLGETDHP
jgi:hypothetical protein